MYKLYSNSFLSESGFDRDGLINFLQQLKIISNQTKAKAEPSELPVYMEYYNDTFAKLIYNKEALLGVNDIWHSHSVFEPVAVADKISGEYASVNSEFTPRELVGINNASTKKELAGEFIKSLYSETIQRAGMGDGFPVNVNALRYFGLEPDDHTFDWDNIVISQPDTAKMQAILDLFKEADTPVIIDQELLNMVISETERYLSGKAELESTADKIITRTKTYLSE